MLKRSASLAVQEPATASRARERDDAERAADPRKPARPVAVIVCHGMGQQTPFSPWF